MKVKVYYICCRIILASFFLFCRNFAANDPDIIQRHFQIYRNQLLVGHAFEIEKRKDGQIYYEKDVEFFSGSRLFSSFSINPNFQSFKGTIRIEGDSVIELDEKHAIINAKGRKKNICFNSFVFPLSIIHLYVHDRLQKSEPIQESFVIFSESTAELLQLRVSTKRTDNYFDIGYQFGKDGILIKEIFFPHTNRYSFEFGSIQYLEKAISNSSLQINRSSLPNRVENSNHIDISQCQHVDYLICSPLNIRVLENEHQQITEEKVLEGEKWTRIKTVQAHELKGEPDNKDEYIRNFSGMDYISLQARKISEKQNNDVDKLTAIMEWIKQTIEYVEVGPIEPAEVLNLKKGDCQGFANLFLAMAAAIGNPVRAAVGLVIFEKRQDYFFAFHQWAEVHDGKKWISYDPTLGVEGIGLNYIKLLNIEKQFDIIKLFSIIDQLQIRIEGGE